MPGDPLRDAFDLLIRAAEPERQARVLRTAIGLLIGDDAPPPARIYAGPIATRQPERWDFLRPQLRALADRERAGRIAVAKAIGVAPTTLARLLGPNSAGPGIVVIERAEQWLASRDAPPRVINGTVPASTAADGATAPSRISIATIAQPSGNGVENAAGEGQLRPLGAPTASLTAQKNCSQPETAPSPAKPAPSHPGTASQPLTNGHDRAGPLPAYQLTVAQRERLAGYATLDPMKLRRAAGVTRDVVDQAVAGRELAPEIIGRLVGFLDEAAPGAGR